MSTIIFSLIMYFIFTGLIGLGKYCGEHYTWIDKTLGFLFGWLIVPIFIGRLIGIFIK